MLYLCKVFQRTTMKKLLFLTTLTLLLLSSCRNYNALQKTTDYDYKYEAAKQAYAAGHYTRAYQLLDELILIMKGTANAEECLFMDAMCYYNIRDYETATLHFDRYYKSYPKGIYTELARFYSGKSSFLQSPDPRLDQTPPILPSTLCRTSWSFTQCRRNVPR